MVIHTNSDILFQDAAWNNVKKTIASHELASKKERPSSAPSLRNTPKPTTPSPVEQRRLEYFSKLSTPRPKPTEPLLLPPSVRNAHTKIGPIDWDRIENLSRPRRRNVPITQEKAWAAIEAGRRPKKLKPMDPVVFERLTRPRSKPEPPPLPPQYKPTSPRKRLLKNSAAEPARETVEGGRISVEAGPEIVIDEHDENMLVEAKSKSVDFDALLQDIISGDLKKTPSGEQVESTESSAVKEFTPSKESDTSNSEEIRSSAQASQEQLFKEYSEASPEDSTVSAIDQTQISIRASKEQLTNDSIDTSSKLLEKEVYMEQIQTSSPAASDRLDASAESNQAVKEPLASIEAEEVRTRDLQEAIAVAESLRSFEKNGVSVISLPSLVSLHDLQDDVVGDAVGRILEAEVQQTSAHDNVISDVELLRQANMNGSRQSLSIRQASQSDVTPQSFQQENIDNVRNLMSLENQAPEKALEDMDSFFDNMVDSSSQPVEVDRLASKALEPEHHTEVETEGFEAGNADESNEEYFDNGPDIQQALDAPEYEDRYEPAKTNGENLDEMKGIYQREAADAEAEHNYLQQSQGADEVSITNNEISLQEGITAFEDIESFFDNTMTSRIAEVS
ncbi:hypothetical protein BC829DRAFT_70042 [Chytridium lagenaria]|nr:hypothetical protein BC829DRAFT_70042 [Chytridium lagenaria]